MNQWINEWAKCCFTSECRKELNALPPKCNIIHKYKWDGGGGERRDKRTKSILDYLFAMD